MAQQVEHNAACESDAHDTHLCFLMYEGFHLSHPDGYREMVRDARFRCQDCGRTAKSAEMLCAPIEL